MKDAYYFPHDSNAKDDPKCSILLEQLGCEGYGIYWILVETLREQPTYKYPVSLLPVIARKYNTTHEKVKVVVCNYGLFMVDDNEFFSLSLNRRMEQIEKMRHINRMKGIKSGEARRLLALAEGNGTAVEQGFNTGSTGVEQKKEKKKKEKETKVIYGSQQNVLLTEAEYQRLKKDFPLLAEPAIEYLSSWIVEKNYVSKSHNLAIRRWVIDAVKKKQPQSQQTELGKDFWRGAL